MRHMDENRRCLHKLLSKIITLFVNFVFFPLYHSMLPFLNSQSFLAIRVQWSNLSYYIEWESRPNSRTGVRRLTHVRSPLISLRTPVREFGPDPHSIYMCVFGIDVRSSLQPMTEPRT